MKVLNYILVLLLFIGCGQSEHEKVYKNRVYLMELCKDKALLKSRGNKLLIFKTIKGGKVNEYYIGSDSGKYKFYRDTLQYKASVIGVKFTRGTENYNLDVCNYVKAINEKLEALEVNGFSTQSKSLGVPFEFYMNDGKVVVYIPDINKTPDYEGYRKSLKKIDDFWYYIN